jgi:large subunit ribosomal protein L19
MPIPEEILNQIKPGVRVKVTEKVTEGKKERGSSFEGIVIARKHGTEIGATFTVRAVLSEVPVEKIYPIHSPNITKVEIVTKPKRVRRAKLYYIRDLSPRKIREKLGV